VRRPWHQGPRSDGKATGTAGSGAPSWRPGARWCAAPLSLAPPAGAAHWPEWGGGVGRGERRRLHLGRACGVVGRQPDVEEEHAVAVGRVGGREEAGPAAGVGWQGGGSGVGVGRGQQGAAPAPGSLPAARASLQRRTQTAGCCASGSGAMSAAGAAGARRPLRRCAQHTRALAPPPRHRPARTSACPCAPRPPPAAPTTPRSWVARWTACRSRR
jgi:hypothetical protein